MEGAGWRCSRCVLRLAPHHFGGTAPQVVTRRAARRGCVETELAVVVGLTVRASGGLLWAGAAIMPGAAAPQAGVAMPLIVSAGRWRAVPSAASPVATTSAAPTAATTATAGGSRKLRGPSSREGMRACLWASRQLGFDLRHVVRNVVIEACVGRASHELTECSVGLWEAVIEHGDEQAVVDGSPSSALDVRVGNHHLVILQSEIVFTEISAGVNVR